jgi:hypothetical protein
MKQMTLWELGKTTDSVVNPIWEQLDKVAKRDTVTRLSLLMTKAASSDHNPAPKEREIPHDA